MLEGLDTIDWSQTSHAYGEATDVPELIRALTHENDETVQYSLNTLFGNIWHQGTVYPATALAVPFLIEIVANRATTDLAGVLQLLTSCGTGSGYLEVHGYLDFYRDQRNTPEFQATIAAELSAVHAAHNAVVAGVDVYIGLINDADKEVRAFVAEILSICHAHAERALDTLKARIAVERHQPVEQSVLPEFISSIAALSSKTRFRAEKKSLQPAETQLFLEWLNAESFPPLGHVVIAHYLVEFGDVPARQQGLNFINRIPDAPVVPIRHWMYELIRTLHTYDVQFAITWLQRMAQYGDLETLRLIPYLLTDIFRLYRIDAEPLVSTLKALLHHTDAQVCERSAFGLVPFALLDPDITQALEQAYSESKTQPMQSTLQKAIERVQKPATAHHYTIPELLAKDMHADESIESVIVSIQNYLEDNPQNRHLFGYVRSLLMRYEEARSDSRTFPLVKALVAHNESFIRVDAARILALLAPHDHADLIVPVLVEQLQGRPAGVIAMDTLSLLAREGIDVSSALPRLNELAHSERRQIEVGVVDTIPLHDKQLREAAQKTIEAITTSQIK